MIWVAFVHGLIISSVYAIPHKAPVVFVKPSAKIELAEELTYPARAEAKVQAAVLAEIEGVVTRIQSPLGETVKRGQSLLTLKQTDPIYQYAPAQVPSPVSGVVSTMEVTEGSRVNKGQKLATVVDPKSLRVRVEVPAQDLSWIQPGLIGEFRFAGMDKPLELKLRGLSAHVDPATGTATAEFDPPANLEFLRPGVTGKISMKVNVRQAFSVPEDALVYKRGDTFLRVVEEGKAKTVPVTLGKRVRGRVEIVSGLKDGDQVVERASGFVAEGEAVQVQTVGKGT